MADEKDNQGLQDYRLDNLDVTVRDIHTSIDSMRHEVHEFSESIKKWLGQSEKSIEIRQAMLETEVAIMRRLMWGVVGVLGSTSAIVMGWFVIKLIGG